MTRHAALLRGVNIGPHNRIAMADLRAVLVSLGYDDVQTVLASGNAVFGASGRPATIERAIEDALATGLGLDVKVLVRTGRELDAVVMVKPLVCG